MTVGAHLVTGRSGQKTGELLQPSAFMDRKLVDKYCSFPVFLVRYSKGSSAQYPKDPQGVPVAHTVTPYPCLRVSFWGSPVKNTQDWGPPWWSSD